jgi:hypothetical protein
MRMTTTVAAVAGIVSISQPALFKWMCKIGSYLEALVARMVEPGRYASEAWGGYVLIAADATTVTRWRERRLGVRDRRVRRRADDRTGDTPAR